MGEITDLQSFFFTSWHEMTSAYVITHVALKWEISQPKWNYKEASTGGFFLLQT